MENKKKIIFDMALNITATAIPIILLQLVIYPIVAQRIPDESYGIMITIFSFLQLVCGTLGTGHNNLRLIKDPVYTDKNETGDFNIIMIIYTLIAVISLFIAALVYKPEKDLVGAVLLGITALVYVLGAYLEVEFRLKINFKAILVKSMFSGAGYALGCILFFITKRWEWIFLFGFLLPLGYTLCKTTLYKEPLKRTPLFKALIRDSIYMDLSGVCTRAMSYADKMLLLPLIGGGGVAIYYTATLFGKIVVLAMNPINSVVLTYISKIKRMSDKNFKLYLSVGLIVCSVGYVICLAISRPVLGLLFPQWVDAAMVYVPVTTLSMCLYTMCNFLTPLTLKFCSMHWQLVINFSTLCIYIAASVAFLSILGLIGFCWGIAISYIFKFIIIIIVYKKTKAV